MSIFTTRTEVLNDIAAAINAGAADAEGYDLDAIADEAYTWTVDHDDNGNQLLNTAGWVQTVDTDEFWEIVEQHAK